MSAVEPLPRVFVGSSTESVEVALAIQEILEHDATCVVWNQGVFQLSHTAIHDLTTQLTSFDFGIFVFAPDDKLTKRGTSTPTVRSNVLLELGLFMGHLGAARSFVVTPWSLNLDIPTDLLGVTLATYNSDQAADLVSALGPACSKIRRALRMLGRRRRETSTAPVQPLEPAKAPSPLPRTRRRVLIGISGASGVGKSTLAYALHGELSQQPLTGVTVTDQSVILCESPGRKLVGAGVSADDDTTFDDYALYFKAHLERLNASTSGIFIYDRTLLDTLAFAEVNRNLVGPWLEFCREVARSYSAALDISVYIPIEDHVHVDGSVDPKYLRAFDAGLRNVLNHYVPDFVTATGSVEDRLATASQSLRERVT